MNVDAIMKRVHETGGATLSLPSGKQVENGYVVGLGVGHEMVVSVLDLPVILRALGMFGRGYAGLWRLPSGRGMEISEVAVFYGTSARALAYCKRMALAEARKNNQFSIYWLDGQVELLTQDGRELRDEEERAKLYDEWKHPLSELD